MEIFQSMKIVAECFDLFEPTRAVKNRGGRSLIFCVCCEVKSRLSRTGTLKMIEIGGKTRMTVIDQNHRASQAARATMNVSCAVCRTNVKVDNGKRMAVTTIAVEGGREGLRRGR